MVLSLLKKESSPIGIDLGSSYLKMAQLSTDSRMPRMVASVCLQVPQDIEAGSAEWQRWAVKAIKKMIQRGGFKGRQVITAMPSDDVFIDYVKVSKNDKNIEQSVLDQIKPKLPFPSENAIVKYIEKPEEFVNGKNEVLVMATDKVKIDHLLAMCERAGLQLKNLSVWPLAIANTYVHFFGRRNSDMQSVVMLLDIGANHTNIVVAKHREVLFARVLPNGYRQITDLTKTQNLITELSACIRYVESSGNGKGIDKLLFLTGRDVSKVICEKIANLAKEMHIPAQIGDVLTAVESKKGQEMDFDRRNSQVDWVTAFGLSLS